MEKIHNLEVYAKSRNELNEGNQSYFAVIWQAIQFSGECGQLGKVRVRRDAVIFLFLIFIHWKKAVLMNVFCHRGLNTGFLSTAYTQNLYLSHSFWKLTQTAEAPNLQNQTLILSLWLSFNFINTFCKTQHNYLYTHVNVNVKTLKFM